MGRIKRAYGGENNMQARISCKQPKSHAAYLLGKLEIHGESPPGRIRRCRVGGLRASGEQPLPLTGGTATKRGGGYFFFYNLNIRRV